MNMRNIAIISLLIIGLIIFCILLILFWNLSNPEYDVDLQRKFSNSSEETAIHKAEEFDLATILNVTRFNGWSYDRTNNPPTEATAYVWPYIIDKEVLDFYQNNINKLKNSNQRVKVHLSYQAEGIRYPDISISYNNLNRTIEINEQTYFVEFTEYPISEDFLDSFSNNSYSHCAIVINNSLEIISSDTRSIQANISNGYFVTRYFDYSESYGPLTGFGGGAEQVIILDQYYSPILILSRPTGGWIS